MKDGMVEKRWEYLNSCVSICWPSYWFSVIHTCVFMCFCACVASWDPPGCCVHIWQTPLKVFSPCCLSVSAPSLLPEWESLPSRPHLSSRPPRPLHSQSSYTPEPLRLPALPQGITPKNPSAPQTVEQQLCTRESARGEGGCCLGIQLRTCFT